MTPAQELAAISESLRQVLVNAHPDEVRTGCWHVVGQIDNLAARMGVEEAANVSSTRRSKT